MFYVVLENFNQHSYFLLCFVIWVHLSLRITLGRTSGHIGLPLGYRSAAAVNLAEAQARQELAATLASALIQTEDDGGARPTTRI